jgi:hypothetical protein
LFEVHEEAAAATGFAAMSGCRFGRTGVVRCDDAHSWQEERTMVLQDLQHDVLQDEEFAEIRAFLAERGVRHDDEAAILAAIRDRGWELKIEDVASGDWSVSIREAGTTNDYDVVVEHDDDRRDALLFAAQVALSWLTTRQAWEAFDRETRQMLAMSAKEFLKRLDAGELDRNEPHVIHLLIMRPLGS